MRAETVLYEFNLISHDPRDDTIDFKVSKNGVTLLQAMAQLVLPSQPHGGTVELKQFMIYGAGANTLGLPVIRAMLKEFLNVFDFDHVVVEGTKRASGANAGRTPRPIRFS